MTRGIAKYALPALLVTGMLAGCGADGQPAAARTPGGPARASASPAPSASPTTRPTPPTPRPGTHLGPAGYGRLKLGMAKAQARKTGLTTGVSRDRGACGGPGDGYLKGSPRPDGDAIEGRLFFSSRTGRLVAIYAFPGMSTPEGVELGTPGEQMRAAYPTWESTSGLGNQIEGRGLADVPGNPDAHYRISITDHKVKQLSLDSNQGGCYE